MYHIYVTDLLKGMAETLIASTYGQVEELPRYADALIPEKPKKEEHTETAEEVIFRMRKRISELNNDSI